MRRIGVAGAALAVVLFWAAAAGSVFLSIPYRGFDEPVLFDYARGMPTRELAAELERLGVIRSRWLFLAMRGLNPRQALLAGEYRFAEDLTPRDVFLRLARGHTYQVLLTVPEGLTRFEIADLIEDYDFDCRDDFLRASENTTAIRDLAPEATTLEGFLFPDTYRLPRRTDARGIVELMVSRFRRVYEEEAAQASAKLDAYKALTLASLVEKETGQGTERELISSVFHNRLERGMRLQCDPTIIYGLIVEDRFRGKIYLSDLKDPTPYNTYVHSGLPPGPIANPGRAALRAALDPAESNYLFFVAKAVGAGKHVFSSTLKDHDRAVAAYRRSERRR